jgi:hypothetical protein
MGKPNPIRNNKPFPKGVSGNPKGRPKIIPLLNDVIAEIVNEPSGKKADQTKIEAVIYNLTKRAIDGDNAAAKILLEYAYGKPKQQIELTGDLEINSPSYVLPDGTKIEL